MTGRDWKPGDVGVSTKHGYVGMVVSWPACTNDAHDRGLHWHNESGGWDPMTDERRPLVVIDPDDGADVERLESLVAEKCGWVKQDITARRIPAFREALREFANPTPPKPDEPTGLGAVVEDAEGYLWVRRVASANDDDYLGKPWLCGSLNKHWQVVTAVRVISEGVPS